MSALAAITDTPNRLARYEAMCSAIAECVAVDEAKDIRDKSMALEAYYRQARNHEAEREAANVRLRAERRVGELLKDLARIEPAERNPQGRNQHEVTSYGATKPPSPYAETLERQGISRQAAHRFQALANVPAETFEAALAAPEKASTSAILKYADARREAMTPTPRVSDDALWLWGRLRDFENNGYFHADPRAIRDGMTDAMRADVRRLLPLVRDFFNDMEQALEPA